MRGTVTVVVVGERPPPAEAAEAAEALRGARVVIGTAPLLRRVHGLVDPRARTDVLPPSTYDDLEGHRWDLPEEGDDVVVLAPPGRPALAVARSLRHAATAVRFLDEAVRRPHAGPAAARAPVPPLPVTVVGLAAYGDPVASLGGDARSALEGAALVVGGARHLDIVGPLLPDAAERVTLRGDLGPALAALEARDGPAVVLASGDPGFFGVLRVLRERLRWLPDVLHVVPAVSSVAAVAAAAGVPWDDAVVVSAHGREPRRARNAIRRFPVVAVLTEPGLRPPDLAAGVPLRRWTVGSRLGTDEATVRTSDGTPADLPDPVVVLAVDPDAPVAPKGLTFPARRTPTSWALPDDAFAHRDGMVTKAEVRAVALAWLAPGLGDLVWDLGTGSGAVAVECSRLGAAVVAVDRDPDACNRARANAARHGVPVDVVTGDVPGVLAGLADPDAVFVGGGGAALPAILEAAAARRPRTVVVALATLERLAPARAALAAAGYAVDGTQLSAARLVPLGSGTGLSAVNPVTLLRGTRP